MRRPTFAFTALALLGVGAGATIVAACVGEDPVTSATGDAGGADTGPASNDAAGDAGGDTGQTCGACTGTCYRGVCNGNAVVQVASAIYFACALLAQGSVWCWGSNHIGTIKPSPTPELVPPTEIVGLADVRSIASGQGHVCAVKTDDSVWCWGANDDGELGHAPGTQDDLVTCAAGSTCNPKPRQVSGLSALSVAGGVKSSCAVTTVRGVACWGGNGFGQLGNGTTTPSPTPVNVIGLSSIAKVRATQWPGFNVCAIDDAKKLYCWGTNEHGQLGHTPGTQGDGPSGQGYFNATPKKVTTLQDGGGADFAPIDDVAPSWPTCAVKSGAVYCWGFNSGGQRGDGTGGASSADAFEPVAVATLAADVTAIDGNETFCALRSAGDVSCWGNASTGVPGTGSDAGCTPFSSGSVNVACQRTPYAIPNLVATKLALGAAASLAAFAITADGKVLAWGANDTGQLGHPKGSNGDDPTTFVNAVPTPVIGLP